MTSQHTPPGGLPVWRLRRVHDHIVANLARQVGLAELAALVNLTPFHFSRAFKASTGFPPHRYQLHLRLRRAMDLLAQTDMTIAEVARDVGYATVQPLTRLFRAHLGMSPRAYRHSGANASNP